ncbi:MAG: 30S ribosomal protein S17e [Candidatus Woesearchaeota archaeon]
MGRIVPKQIKIKVRELFEKYKDYITTDFQTNKKFVSLTTKFGSKKMRNKIAGYLTRYAKIYRKKYA